MNAYAELHCLSNFSFGRGASSARELFERAKACGYDALAITDECSLAGIVRALEASRDTGVKLIVGAEIQLDDGPKLVLLCETKLGYTTLCGLITRGTPCFDQGHLSAESCRPCPGRAGYVRPVASWADSRPRAWPLDARIPSVIGRGWRWNCIAGRTTCNDCRNCSGSGAISICRWSRPATCTCTCAGASPCRTR